MQVLAGAFLSGIIIAIVGWIASKIIKYTANLQNMSEICQNWNKNNIMEKILFVTGFFSYILMKFMQIF